MQNTHRFCEESNQTGNEPIRKGIYMKKEYDFSKGVRGKFYRTDAELYVPIYLEQDTIAVLRKLAKKRGVEIATIVNEWIKKDISIVETVVSK